ncbi:factor H binding protein domain-containing protein [Glaesserella sp.]|uniref:factor H binding protein domain-containing protein n=1 Tax=Glaesserella sp. TaxID=2094731 RepID=UPI00359FD203
MKKQLKLSLTVLSLSVLTACSGGGGADSAKAIENQAQQASQAKDKVQQPANNAVANGKNAIQTLTNAEASAVESSTQAANAIQAVIDKRGLTEATAPIAQKAAIIQKEAAMAAEVALLAAKEKLDASKSQVEAARRAVELASLRAKAATVEAETAASVAANIFVYRVEPSDARLSAIKQTLTTQQQALFTAYNGLNSEEIALNLAKAQAAAEQLNTAVTVAQGVLDEAYNAQHYAQTAYEAAVAKVEEMKTTIEAAKAYSFVDSSYQDAVRQAKTITIDETEISLIDETLGYEMTNIGDKQVKAYNLAYSAAGYVLPKNVKTDSNGQLMSAYENTEGLGYRAVGLSTEYTNLPSSSSDTYYYGKSFGVKTEGNLELTVNFANKTLSGSVTDRIETGTTTKLSDIILEQANITPSDENIAEFSGKATYKTKDNIDVTGSYLGQFMGPNAEEAVGQIKDANGYFYEAYAGSSKEPFVTTEE